MYDEVVKFILEIIFLIQIFNENLAYSFFEQI